MTRASTRRRPRRQRGDADPPGPHGSRPRGTARSAPPGGGRLRWRWGRACPSGQPHHLADVTRHRSSAAILVAPSGRDTRFLAPDGSRQVGVMRRAMSAKGAGRSGDCWTHRANSHNSTRSASRPARSAIRWAGPSGIYSAARSRAGDESNMYANRWSRLHGCSAHRCHDLDHDHHTETDTGDSGDASEGPSVGWASHRRTRGPDDHTVETEQPREARQ